MTGEAQEVRVSKSFSVSKAALYRAWTEEGELKQWWKPMNKQLVKVENDIRPGGRVVYTFDNELTVHGRYKEAAPGEKLVYSWIWDLPDDAAHKGEYLLTVVFKGDDRQSELEISQSDFKEEHSVKPHHEGWERSLNDLQQYLESKR